MLESDETSVTIDDAAAGATRVALARSSARARSSRGAPAPSRRRRAGVAARRGKADHGELRVPRGAGPDRPRLEHRRGRAAESRWPTRCWPPTSAGPTRPRTPRSRSTPRPARSRSGASSSTSRATSRASGTRPPTDFGRIAAQTAKQVLMQLIRDIQRQQMYEEFANREGDIVSGTVQQNDNRYTLLDLGKRRGAAAPGRADRLRALRPRRARQGLHRRGPQDQQGPPDRRQPHPPRAGGQALRDRGPRDRQRASSRSRRSPASPATAPRSPSAPTTTRSTRSARASARAAAAVRNITNELRSLSASTSCRTPRTRSSSSSARWPRRASARCASTRRGDRDGHRARPAAVARHRQGGPERPPRRAAHGVAHRHPLGERGRRGGRDEYAWGRRSK